MNVLKAAMLGIVLLLSACKKEETVSEPSSLTINRIEVIRYQELNNGASWDPTDGPDLTLQIAKGNNIVWTSLTFIENPIYGNVQGFSMQPPYSFDAPSAEYTMSLFDVDSQTEKEFMGAITFTPFSGTSNPPEVLNLDDGGDVAFKVYVTYNY